MTELDKKSLENAKRLFSSKQIDNIEVGTVKGVNVKNFCRFLTKKYVGF